MLGSHADFPRVQVRGSPSLSIHVEREGEVDVVKRKRDEEIIRRTL